jgi:hypothetical protein
MFITASGSNLPKVPFKRCIPSIKASSSSVLSNSIFNFLNSFLNSTIPESVQVEVEIKSNNAY